MFEITAIILIWVCSPLIELGIIVWLLSERDKYKRQLQEFNKGEKTPIHYQKRMQTSVYGSWPEYLQTGTPAVVSASQAIRQEIEQEAEQDVNEQIKQEVTEQINQEVNEQVNEQINQEVNAQVNKQINQEKQEVKARIKALPRRNTMGTAALILGIIFIVLAGVIFATTTWKILADSYKVLLIFASSVLFFSTSAMAKKWFAIRKTSNALYLLGSIFLFLSVLAAAYFQIFGPEFILEGRNRWKVLWIGSLVLEGAFLVGIKCFNERMYTQATLWGMSFSMLFMAKALQVSFKDFLLLMALYSFGLVIAADRIPKKGNNLDYPVKESAVRALLSKELPLFSHIHFWIFGTLTMFQCLLELGVIFPRSFFGGAALCAVTLGMRNLMKNRQKTPYIVMYTLAVSEVCFYSSLLLGEHIFCSEGILLFFLAVLTVWDIKKNDYLEIPVLVMGAVVQLYVYLEEGTDVWWFVYTLFLAIYLLRYYTNKYWKKTALSASAGLFALALWGESFIPWPNWIELECNLFPAVFLIWAMGEIWGKSLWVRRMQKAGYVLCLGILAWDAYITGLLIDALITELCCLAVFIWNQVKKDVWMVKISGGLMLLIVLFMTKAFWLSISWWIYLLAAGIGLILFAAVVEKRKS